MIARLQGLLAEKAPGSVLIDVGGVGYQAMIPLSTFYKLPEEGTRVALEVVTNLRENALELFAFDNKEERELFNTLRSISGIGPRLGLSILSGIDPDEFSRVVIDGDTDRLTKIPGVGRKTAERIVVELKDKLEKRPARRASAPDSMSEDAILALVTLGYKRSDASSAVREAAKQNPAGVAGLIKGSLARLAGG